jgi:hypothetical protein
MANLLEEKINNCRTRIARPLEEWKPEPSSNPVFHPGIPRMLRKDLSLHCAVLEK